MKCPGCPECLVCSKKNSSKTDRGKLSFEILQPSKRRTRLRARLSRAPRRQRWTLNCWREGLASLFQTGAWDNWLLLTPNSEAKCQGYESHFYDQLRACHVTGWGLPCLSVGNMLTGNRLMLSEQFVILSLLPRKEVNGSSHLSRWIILAEESSLFSCESLQAVCSCNITVHL